MHEYRVNANIERPDPEIVARYAKLHLHIVMLQTGVTRDQIMDPGIRPLAENDWHICGPAVTVALDEPDHLMPAAAIKVAKPGDVLVIASRGQMDRAPWGGSLSRSAKMAGVNGVVIDGPAECHKPILWSEMPVFCRGVYPSTGNMDKPGSINVPVVCGGALVNPGDLIIGTIDGVVVVRKEVLAEHIDQAEVRHARWAKMWATPPDPNAPNFFDARDGMSTLAKLGVQWID